MKTDKDYWRDWEQYAFGYGYGTGEQHTVAALRKFMENVPLSGTYDYQLLEENLGHTVAWMLINILCHADIIEYGTSPRFGWLTQSGKNLQKFILSNDTDKLLESLQRNEDDAPCYPDHCNCGDEKCNNPFWAASDL